MEPIKLKATNNEIIKVNKNIFFTKNIYVTHQATLLTAYIYVFGQVANNRNQHSS